MRTAFLVPGQGAGTERELGAWHAKSGSVRRFVEQAAIECRMPVRRVLDQASGAWTIEVLEAVHTALCLGIHEEFGLRGLQPDTVAGHSLGEMAACAIAGCCSAEDAIALSAERGRLMGREAGRRPGGMLAVGAPDPEAIRAAVAFARPHGIVALAAHNAPGQWLVSGEWPALRRVATRFATTPLPVGGAWHSDVLAPAVDEFRAACRKFLARPIRVPLVSNRTGLVVERVEQLPDLLAEQFTHPVLWMETMTTLRELGVTRWVMVGPSRALRGWLHAAFGTTVVPYTSERIEDLEASAALCAP